MSRCSKNCCSLQHDKPAQFATSQWQGEKPSRVFLLYRWLLPFYLVSTLIYSAVEEYFRQKWYVYMTNWAFAVLTLQAVLAAALATIYACRREVVSVRMTFLHKTYWVLNTVGNAVAPLVTLTYWALIHGARKVEGAKSDVVYLNISTHVVNTLVVVVDIFISNHPVRLGHAYMLVIASLMYSSGTVIYYYAGGTGRNGGTALYPILDWSTPEWALLTCVLVTLAFIFMHGLCWLLHRIRQRIAKALLNRENKQSSEGMILSTHDKESV